MALLKKFHRYSTDGCMIAGAFLAVVFMANICSAAFNVHWQSSTDAARWTDRGTSVSQAWSAPLQYMEAFPDSQRQMIDGFGGCFNELEWTALNKLSAASRDSVIKSLYDTTAGCRFNMGRMPVGANDYALNYYSHDDSAGDYSMAHFSIARHQQYVIPFIKAAMNLRPDLKMWGSPWTPPAWMKTNGNYAGGSITWTSQNLGAYALYLEKCVLAYRAAGLNFTALFVQNEPWSNNNYPTCTWTPANLRDFVKLYLGPRFKSDNVPAQLWYSTVNNANFQSAVGTALDDSLCRGYLSGVGYQWEGYSAMYTHYKRYPSVPFWQTETKCGSGVNDWSWAESQYGDRKWAFDSGAQAFFEWNMVLEKGGVSAWGWVQSAMISIDTSRKTVTYNPEYYVSKHFSYYVNPGARYIKMTGTYGDKVGFINPNGDVVIVVRNGSTSGTAAGIKIDNQMFLPTIAGKSFNTFVFNGVRPPSVSIVNKEQREIPVNSSRVSHETGPINGIEVYDFHGKRLFSSGKINGEMSERYVRTFLFQSLRGTPVSRSVVIVKIIGKNRVARMMGTFTDNSTGGRHQ
jgi:glucosylceramidase